MARLSLGELAARLGAEVRGDPSLVINGVAELTEAQPGQIAPLTDPSRLADAAGSRATAFLVARPLPAEPRAQLVCTDSRRALAQLLELLREPGHAEDHRTGVDPRSAVDPSASVHPTAWVGPFTYLARGVTVGPGARIEPFCWIGEGARVGAGCRVGPHATLGAGCALGDGVVLGAGAVVGGEGFGFWQSSDGVWHRLRSAGRVELESDVEVGAGSCIDRGTLGATRVGRGTKIDNLVQVGHNAQLGRDVLICAQTGLAGSVRLEDGCVLGGQAGVADHLRLGSGARVAAQGGVVQDVAARAAVAGYPAMPHRGWLRASVLFSRLPELWRQLTEVRQQLTELRRQLPGRRDDSCPREES